MRTREESWGRPTLRECRGRNVFDEDQDVRRRTKLV